MKKTTLLSALAVAILPFSCSKEDGGKACGTVPVVFSASGTGLRAEVKSQAGRLESFYVSAVPGDASTPDWTNERFSGNDSYTGRIYWPEEDPSYSFFASSLPLSEDPSGIVLRLGNSMQGDVVCAYLPRSSVVFREENELHFEHILCRAGGMPSVSLEPGCVLEELGISFRPDTAGVYNIAGRAWAETVAVAAAKDWKEDLLFIPGSYPMEIRWTVSAGGVRKSYRKTTPAVDFVAGTSINLSLTLGMSAGQLSCSLKTEEK